MFSYGVHIFFKLLLKLKGRIQKSCVPGKLFAAAKPILVRPQARSRLKGKGTFKTDIDKGIHYGIHIDGAEEGDNVLVFFTHIVVNVYRIEVVAYGKELLVLAAFNIAVARVPTGVKHGVVYKV